MLDQYAVNSRQMFFQLALLLFFRGIVESGTLRCTGAVAILVCKSERNLGRVSKLPRGAGVGSEESGVRRLPLPHSANPTPLPSKRVLTSQIALAFTNQDGDSFIKAYQSRESHGKKGGCEQFKYIYKKLCVFGVVFFLFWRWLITFSLN